MNMRIEHSGQDPRKRLEDESGKSPAAPTFAEPTGEVARSRHKSGSEEPIPGQKVVINPDTVGVWLAGKMQRGPAQGSPAEQVYRPSGDPENVVSGNIGELTSQMFPDFEANQTRGGRIIYQKLKPISGSPTSGTVDSDDTTSLAARIKKFNRTGRTKRPKTRLLDEILSGALSDNAPTGNAYYQEGFAVHDRNTGSATTIPRFPGIEDIIQTLRDGKGPLAQFAAEAAEVSKVMEEERALENRTFQEQIAQLNGINPEDVKANELLLLYKFRMLKRYGVERTPQYLIEKYVGKDATTADKKLYGENYGDRVDRARAERFQDIAQLTEGLLDLPPTHYSYGLHMPSYSAALMIAPESHPASRQNHRALLVGALTASTVREFAATINIVHPNATKLVTDVKGETTAKVDPALATFLYGDARRLPVADGSVDSIHTNILTQFLEPDNNYASPAFHFFQEAHRALAPNGQLIMVEPIQDVDSLVNSLRVAGFTDIVSLPALRFNSRRAVLRSLTLGKYDDPSYITETARFEAVIITTKQSKGTTLHALRNGEITIPTIR